MLAPCPAQAQYDAGGNLWYSGRQPSGACADLLVCQGDDPSACQRVLQGSVSNFAVASRANGAAGGQPACVHGQACSLNSALLGSLCSLTFTNC